MQQLFVSRVLQFCASGQLTELLSIDGIHSLPPPRKIKFEQLGYFLESKNAVSKTFLYTLDFIMAELKIKWFPGHTSPSLYCMKLQCRSYIVNQYIVISKFMARLDVTFVRMQITSLILQVAIIYACTKGSEDVFYAYLPLLLTDKLQFEKVCTSKLLRN